MAVKEGAKVSNEVVPVAMFQVPVLLDAVNDPDCPYGLAYDDVDHVLYVYCSKRINLGTAFAPAVYAFQLPA